MKANFAICLPEMLKHEGGWADHPKDPGGATMKGVTLKTFRRLNGSANIISALPKQLAESCDTLEWRQNNSTSSGATTNPGSDTPNSATASGVQSRWFLARSVSHDAMRPTSSAAR